MKALTISKSITNREAITSYLKDISKIPLLNKEEELELAHKAKNGDTRAFNKLVTSNLRFVVSVAKQYQNKGLDLPDLINEGNIGLVKAVKKFDPDKGYKLISYAVWWIRQSIMMALYDSSRPIRLPLSQVLNISKILKTIKEFEQKSERKPTNEELSKILNIPADKIAKLLEYNTKTISFDTPFSDEEDAGSLIDVIPNKNSIKTDKTLTEESEDKNINTILNLLNYREHDVIMMFFGINCQQMSLDDIGRKFGITSERVRQVKEKALSKLRGEHLALIKKILYG